MIGGGFLGQMHDTMRKNRDLVRSALGKSKREACDNGEYPTTNKFIDKDKKKLSKEEKAILIERVRKENKREILKRGFNIYPNNTGVIHSIIWVAITPSIYR